MHRKHVSVVDSLRVIAPIMHTAGHTAGCLCKLLKSHFDTQQNQKPVSYHWRPKTVPEMKVHFWFQTEVKTFK